MNNKLIQELLDDKETRDALWAALMEADDTGINIHDLMLAALNKLNDEPAVGDDDHNRGLGSYVGAR